MMLGPSSLVTPTQLQEREREREHESVETAAAATFSPPPFFPLPPFLLIYM